MQHLHDGKTHSRRVVAGAAAVLACLLCGAAQAQWKWVEDNGHVQYSDVPPPASVPERRILQRPGGMPAPAAAPAAPEAAAGGDAKALEARKQALEHQTVKAAQAPDPAQQQARAENCARTQSYIRTLQSGMRVARTNTQGEREVLDDTARNAELQRAQQIAARDCVAQ